MTSINKGGSGGTPKVRQRASTVETTSRDLENSIMFSSSNMPTPKPKIINTLDFIKKNEGEPDFDPKTGKTTKRKNSGSSTKRDTKEAWGSSPDKAMDNSITDSPQKPEPPKFEGKEPELEMIQGTHGQGGLPLFRKGNKKECFYCLRRDLTYVLMLENCGHSYCPHCLL